MTTENQTPEKEVVLTETSETTSTETKTDAPVEDTRGAQEPPKKTAVEENRELSNYIYAPDAKVVISGELFTAINTGLIKLIEKETEQKFTTGFKTEDEFFGQAPITLISSEGMMIQMLLREMKNAHKDNIKLGNAITREENEKPKIELVR